MFLFCFPKIPHALIPLYLPLWYKPHVSLACLLTFNSNFRTTSKSPSQEPSLSLQATSLHYAPVVLCSYQSWNYPRAQQKACTKCQSCSMHEWSPFLCQERKTGHWKVWVVICLSRYKSCVFILAQDKKLSKTWCKTFIWDGHKVLERESIVIWYICISQKRTEERNHSQIILSETHMT